MPSRQPYQPNPSNPAARALAEARAHHQAGRLPKAERLYRVALGLRAGDPETLFYLGNVLREQGNPEAALACYMKALQARPDFPEAYVNMGACWCDIGDLNQAVSCFEKALNQRPDLPEARVSLGNVLRELGQPMAALDCYAKALEFNPDDSTAYVNVGICWLIVGDVGQAILMFEEALKLKPNDVNASLALSDALMVMGRHTEARSKLDRAYQLEPDNPEMIGEIGKLLYNEGKIDEALKLYNKSLARAPKQQKVQWDKSLALLTLGQYREGWKLYEAGIGRRELRGLNLFPSVKPWNGQPALGKHLLIVSEQGLGDSLQFIRYAELCKERFARISVFCPHHNPLVRLFKGLSFVDDAFDTIQAGSHFDEHILMASLPHVFGTVLETVPAAVPYLRVDPEIETKWATKFVGVAGLKVGLVWAGRAANKSDRERSIGLDRIRSWLDMRGAQFYSLQKDEQAEKVVALGLQNRITDFMGEVEDFADTAAIVQNLDLVITVDTSVAHLAGGLGKPVWILSRYNADWRWLQNRPTNPWYPTARIFGQPSMGDWDSVIAEVGRELALEIAKKAH